MNLSSLWMLKYAEIFNFAESIQAKRVLRGSFTCHIIIWQACLRISHPENLPPQPGIETATLGIRGGHVTLPPLSRLTEIYFCFRCSFFICSFLRKTQVQFWPKSTQMEMSMYTFSFLRTSFLTVCRDIERRSDDIVYYYSNLIF